VLKVPKIVGVLNITPDSFSDGGLYYDEKAAIEAAKNLILAGADIIDIGAESTRTTQRIDEVVHKEIPQREPIQLINETTEWDRLSAPLPEIIKLAKEHNVKVSIDTRHVTTVEKIIEHNYNVDIINDVTGFTDPNMLDVVAHTNFEVIVMHNLGIPANPQIVINENIDAVEEVKNWFVERVKLLNKSGINNDRIILDPGIGFGKTAEQSWQLIKQIKQFAELGNRLLVGHSRKSFFNLITNLPSNKRDIETYAASIFLAQNNVDYIRVHDVEGNKRTLKTAQMLF